MMNTIERKKVGVITKYVNESFSEGDWYAFGQLIGQLTYIQKHPRLLRSLNFGDEDYEYCVAEVLDHVFNNDSTLIDEVIENFDIDLWYEQRDPLRHSRVFQKDTHSIPKFWKQDYLRIFISHLASSREKVSYLKASLEGWGISSFIAHQDIEPSKEWQVEIEAGLNSMALMIAFIEPGFINSAWTDQEVGYALGRNIDVLPILIGENPHGFIGKIQGINAKGKIPSKVSQQIILILLKKPRYRKQLLAGMSKAFSIAQSNKKIWKIRQINDWNILTDDQMRDLLERSLLSNEEKKQLNDIVSRVDAFKAEQHEELVTDDDIPF